MIGTAKMARNATARKESWKPASKSASGSIARKMSATAARMLSHAAVAVEEASDGEQRHCGRGPDGRCVPAGDERVDPDEEQGNQGRGDARHEQQAE